MKKLITLFFATIAFCNTMMATSVNYVTNGQFETDTNGWYSFNNSGSQTFGVDATNPILGTKSLLITITQSNSSTGAIGDQWMLGTRWGMSTYKSGRYSVHFKAKASRALKLVSMFQQNFANYASWGYVEWNLTTSVQDFNVILDNNQDVGGYWAFCYYYGHLSTGDQLWIDDVQITEVPNSTGSLTDGNVCNGDFEANIANLNGTTQGWQKSQTTPANFTYSLETSTPISGATTFKATSVVQGSVGYQSMLSWNFYPVMGAHYSIQFKAKATTSVTIAAEIWDMWNSGNRYNNLGFANFNVTTSVQTFSFDFPNPVNIYYPFNCNIWLGTLPAGESIWIDDVRIFQTGTPEVTTQLIGGESNENICIKTAKLGVLVNVNKVSSVNIYNIAGQRIISKEINAGESIIVIKKGIYIVQVIQNGIISKSTKIVI